MRRVKLITAATVMAVTTLLVSYVAAQDPNTSERTFLTFSGAVEMPGLTLQPGTYVFKLADTGSRNVIQVWNREEKEMLGQWLFVQAERSRVSDENVVMFRETPAGTTPAVQYWYYPGERIGKEFIYPKDQAARIAKATGGNVLTGDDSASVSSVNAQGEVTQWKREETQVAAASPAPEPQPAPAPEPEPAPAQARAPEPEPAPVAAPAAPEPAPRPVATSGVAEAQEARAETLPQTASPLALTGLLGLLSLAGAAGIRAYRG